MRLGWCWKSGVVVCQKHWWFAQLLHSTAKKAQPQLSTIICLTTSEKCRNAFLNLTSKNLGTQGLTFMCSKGNLAPISNGLNGHNDVCHVTLNSLLSVVEVSVVFKVVLDCMHVDRNLAPSFASGV